MDAQGNEVIPAQLAEANDFHADRAIVKIRDNEYALIGTDEPRACTYAYAYVGSPGDGLLTFQKEASGKYGYIDERGHRMLQPAYTSAFPFHEGRAIVNTGADRGPVHHRAGHPGEQRLAGGAQGDLVRPPLRRISAWTWSRRATAPKGC